MNVDLCISVRSVWCQKYMSYCSHMHLCFLRKMKVPDVLLFHGMPSLDQPPLGRTYICYLNVYMHKHRYILNPMYLPEQLCVPFHSISLSFGAWPLAFGKESRHNDHLERGKKTQAFCRFPCFITCTKYT